MNDIKVLWTSKNGLWNIVKNGYCRKDSIAIESEESLNCYYAILYKNGSIGYDSTCIPSYVKKEVEKILNPCLGVVAKRDMIKGTLLYTMYKLYKYHLESLNQTYNNYIMTEKEFDRVLEKGSYHGYKFIEVLD